MQKALSPSDSVCGSCREGQDWDIRELLLQDAQLFVVRPKIIAPFKACSIVAPRLRRGVKALEKGLAIWKDSFPRAL